MTWDKIQQVQLDVETATKDNAKNREEVANLAKAYHRCFNDEDGKRVLADLTARFIYNNDTSFSSTNVNYESAYHNGEAGVVKFLINQIQQAEIL